MSTRLGRPAVEAQIKAGVSRLFWGESVQERAANAARQKKEEEEKEMKRKEEERKRKEEIRSIMREGGLFLFFCLVYELTFFLLC